MAYAVSVRDFGALGNGVADDAPAFQKALDAGARVVTAPYGQYRIGSPLKIGSDTTLEVHPSATIRLGDHVCVRRGQYLLSNKEEEGG
ncbi:MAG TPA: glycosyl hydrolase family 28-related protein, partial [Clostridia bacterium]|nr:glycosyl hydrolase family 28-related protein [Clostridia bacterium]